MAKIQISLRLEPETVAVLKALSCNGVFENRRGVIEYALDEWFREELLDGKGDDVSHQALCNLMTIKYKRDWYE